MPALRLIELLAVTLACAAAPLLAREAEPFGQSNAPISVNADKSDVDFRSGKTLLRNVTISQGDVSIQAEQAEATGIQSEDSRWEFTGNVRIVAEKRGSLHSDQAVVEIHKNRITRATASGAPAEFEQKREGTAEMARGHAREIVYEIDAGTIRFTDNAWLSNGAVEASGPLLVYNIRQQKVQGTTSPGAGQRIQITIVPKTGEKTVVKPLPAPAAPQEPKP